MDIREKLVELLRTPFSYELNKFPGASFQLSKYGAETLADILLANGVIIQEWIPISNRLPTKEDTYDGATILAVDKEYGIADPWSLESVLKYPQDFICWTQVPQPPTGE